MAIGQKLFVTLRMPALIVVVADIGLVGMLPAFFVVVASLGLIAPNATALALADTTARTAGSLPEQVILTATADDVSTVVISGRVIARDGVHQTLGEVGPLLADSMKELWP